MLKPVRHCTHCGAEMEIIRSTKSYCSDACRKRAARGIDIEQQAESRWIVECLRHIGLVSKVWPVYSWDGSLSIFALMVTTQNSSVTHAISVLAWRTSANFWRCPNSAPCRARVP
jgi:predicted nucleic acid-binding Zn ribbon protein